MKRKLTPKEIEKLIDFIEINEYLPLAVAETLMEQTKDHFRKQLYNIEVHPAIIPELKKEMFRQYRMSIIQAGESVGIISAQSNGEKQTQTALNTFHQAGQSEKTMTVGIPRFKELINASKKPKIVNHKVYFNKFNDTIQNIRKVVGHSIAGLTLSNITTNIEIIMNKKPESWYNAYKILFDDSFEKCEHCIRCTFNIQKLFDINLSLGQIAEFIHSEYYDLHCVFSPPTQGIIDIFVDTNNIILPENRLLFIDQENAPYIYISECVKPILEKLYVCGIPAITEVFFTREGDEWIVETNGFNSKKISTKYSSFKKLLMHPDVDYTRTISNNVWDIYEVFDIEAARQFLIESLLEIMDGINSCHVSLLVDRMTYKGTISSISRYTLGADESGPLGKATYEQTMDNFLNAAAQGQKEPTQGVSASIICGKRANLGTGICDVSINIDMLQEDF